MLYVNTTLLEMKILFGLIVGILLHPHPFLPETVCRNDTGTHNKRSRAAQYILVSYWCITNELHVQYIVQYMHLIGLLPPHSTGVALMLLTN